MRPLLSRSSLLGTLLIGACGSSAPATTAPSGAPPAMAGTRPVPFKEPYPSMDDCMKVWKLKVAEYEKMWGEADAENGAAYWKSSAENKLLACNPYPEPATAAEMELSYLPPDPSVDLPLEPGNPAPFRQAYPGMDECLAEWKTKRAEYDKKWGASGTDNGAAYWKTTTRNIELACNPVEKPDGSDSAEMLLRYSALED